VFHFIAVHHFTDLSLSPCAIRRTRQKARDIVSEASSDVLAGVGKSNGSLDDEKLVAFHAMHTRPLTGEACQKVQADRGSGARIF